MPNHDKVKGRILVVDDDPGISGLLAGILTAEGHTVTQAHDGVQALEAIAGRAPDLILLDLDMPNLGGFAVCQQVKRDPATRLIPVVIVTGQAPYAARLRAWDLGADDFLSKPFNNVEVLTRCHSLLRLKRLTDSLDTAQSLNIAFARAVEAKSPYTLGHSERVASYAITLGERVGLSDADISLLYSGGLLHDIGKIGIPDHILNKPGRLTPEEYEVVKQHPVQGVRIVEPLRSLRNTIPLIRWHHERCDGGGYPDGLFMEAIPLVVRVLAVADVYDALRSSRPYRPALSHDECLDLLRSNAANGGLDPHLVEPFVEVMAGGRCGPRIDLPSPMEKV